MSKRVISRIVVPVVTALCVGGCCSSSPKTVSSSRNQVVVEPQGAPVLEPKTELVSGSGGLERTNQAEIQLHKEEMVVGKRAVSNGGVLIRTVVQTEDQSLPVELQREEYVIERIPASEAAALGTENAFLQREVYIPLTREEPVASKRALLSEKVQLSKRIETDRQTVSSPVRSEDIEITKIEGKAPGNIWSEAPATVAPARPELNALNLMREEMVVGKRVVENGAVKLQKVVRTQVATQPVELTREEYTIERNPVAVTELAPTDFASREIRLNLSREEPVVGTRIQPTEVVRVHKQVHTDVQTVSGTVRKENIEVVKLNPETAMGGTSAAGVSGTTVVAGANQPRQVRINILGESPAPRQVTLKGTALCAKCQLHESGVCQNVIQVKERTRTRNYYLVQNEVSHAFHEDVCRSGKNVVATGSVSEISGRLTFTPSRISLMH